MKKIKVTLAFDVKLTVFDALTTMESSLLKSPKNFEIVRQMRNVVYEAVAETMTGIISDSIGYRFAYEKSNINLKKGMEQIVFKIVD